MKITLEYLEKKSACSDGIEFVTKNGLIGLEDKDFIKKLIELKKLNYANWLIVRVLSNVNTIKYAIFAAEQVIDIFEKECPDDDRPRRAIEAAKAYISNPCKETKKNAAAAYASANAAYAAADAAADAAAADAANAAMLKIIKYGINLL